MMRRCRPALAAAMLAAAFAPGAAHAQYIHNDAPPLPAAPAAGVYESPSAKLARNVRILAAQPKNLAALLEAGRASLALGDLPSAEGFFARADEINPNGPAPKVGMGGAAILSGNVDEAERWFAEARRLGAAPSLLGVDRGLMYDLKGDLGAAQADYRAALGGPDPDEARRRYALSLAMGGKSDEGLRTLQPLLSQRDPAAMRVRAFVLALGGHQQAAVQAIDQAMPGSGARIAPFFSSLPILGIPQKAAAVHLGVFPTEAEVRLAQAQAAARPAPVVVASATPPARTSSRSRRKKDKAPEFTVSVARTPIAAPQQPAPQPAPVQIAAVSPSPAPSFSLPSTAAPAQQPAVQPAATDGTDRLSGIDKLLAQSGGEPLPPPPPPPRPKVEKEAEVKPASASKAADARKLAEAKRLADAKKAEARKAAEEKKAAEALGVSGSTWVQLAGGSNADRLASEYKRIRAKKPDLFAKRAGHVSQGKDYFRLLVGPFKDAGEARTFVNSLAKAGIDAFMWTRTPPAIRIEKISSK